MSLTWWNCWRRPPLSLMRFGQEITHCEFVDGRWRLTTVGGYTDEVDVVIAATGVLHHPNYPDIEGLGDKQVKFLFESGRIVRPGDIFRLEVNDQRRADRLQNHPGWGKLSTENLFGAIEARRGVSFDRLIYALGIRHVGRKVAADLAEAFGTFEALQVADEEELMKLVNEPVGEEELTKARDYTTGTFRLSRFRACQHGKLRKR